MRKAGPAVLLEDIERYAMAAADFVTEIGLEEYRRSQLRRFAVERALEVAGESLRRLELSHPELAARIPQLRAIVGFRNLLAHGYAELDDARVHAAAAVHAPQLAKIAQQLLLELEEDF